MEYTKILLIEDSEDIRFLLTTALTREGYYVLVAKTAGEAIEILDKGFKPCVTILDLMLPDMNGLNLIATIRKNTIAPIIIASAKSNLIEKIVGLEAGADDYLSKPFEVTEMLARVRSHIRRFVTSELPNLIRANNKNLIFSEFSLNIDSFQVYNSQGKRMNLTLNEVVILKTLLSNPGRIYTREQLLSATRDHGFEISERAIDTQIARIRKKLYSPKFGEIPIKCSRGDGYLYAKEVKITEQ